jgi:predicted Zn-dependent protease
MRNYHLISSYILLLLLFTSCARNPVTGKREFVVMSERQEIAMGREYDPQIVQAFGLHEDEKLQAFIEQKGQEMAAISHRSNLEYEFKILDSPILNAFAVPGGYVYFTRGIMAHFNNEAEFAGVLGHEIGHIAARHTVQQQSRNVLAQVGVLAGVIAMPELAQFLDPASQALGLLFLKYGRDAERESDRLGVEYSTKVGYDAREMAGFFRTLERQQERAGGGSLPDFLSTHPSPADRNKRVAELAAEWQQKENLQDPSVNRDSYLRMIEGMIYGEDPRQGFLENNTFYHPELRFMYNTPAGWQYRNSPQEVQLSPKEGDALLRLTLVSGENLRSAAEAQVKQYQLEVEKVEERKINGLDAVQVSAVQNQEQGAVRVEFFIYSFQNRFYLLLGAAQDSNFTKYSAVFLSTFESFAELKDSEKLNRQPDRIRLVKVEREMTLKEFLAQQQIPEDKHEELAILNGLEFQDRLISGMLLKLIR